MGDKVKKSETEKQKKSKNEHITMVARTLDISYDEAKTMMKKLKDSYELKYSEYWKNRFWEVPAAEQETEARRIVDKRKARIDAKERRLSIIVSETSLSHDEAAALMKKAKDEYGINNKEFMKSQLYKYPENEFERAYRAYLQIGKNEYITKVAQTIDMTYDEAKAMMKKAKDEYGIKYKDFAKLQLYSYPEDEIEGIYRAYCEEKLQKRRNKYIVQVARILDITYDEARAMMKPLKDSMELKYVEYLNNKFWEIPEDEQKTAAKKIVSRRKANKEVKERRIETIVSETSLSHEEAAALMNKARADYGISNKEFMSLQLYKYPEDQIQAVYEAYCEEKRQETNDAIEEYYQLIMSATGWSREKAEEEYHKAREARHCTLKEFYIYHFYELTEEQRNDVFLLNDSKEIMRKFDTDRVFVSIICNKHKTNEFFSDCVIRPWCNNLKITEDEFKEKFKNSHRIIYKPLEGHKGFGIQAYALTPENMSEVYAKLRQLPEGVVEQFVKQHPDINKITDASLNTIRVVTISSNTKPVTPDGKKFDIAYAAFRMGGGTAIVDNFHSGGICAVINKETGEIETDAVDGMGKVFAVHPMTKTKIKGFKIPFFKEALDMVEKACTEREIEGYLGWDVAISEDGPELIEVNTQPGVVLISTPYAVEKKGAMPMMRKYLG